MSPRVQQTMNVALAKAMEEEQPQCRPVNISSGEDTMSDEEASWAWAQHQAEHSPHSVAEVQ